MSDIKIVPYDSKWPIQFEQIKQKILSELGDFVLSIDHIGSTSVKGLSAKNIIDLQLTVKTLENDNLIAKLKGLGCEYFEHTTKDNLVGVDANSIELQKRFFRYQSEFTAHIHIRVQGRLNQQYPILFRDYLRANESAKLSYEKIKIELAKRFSNDSQSYYAIKDPVMDGIYTAAKIWRNI